MRGRRPLPTEHKKLTGNPGKRPLNADEPVMPAAPPSFDEPPAELDGNGIAQDEWRRTIPMLRERKVITQAERGSLIALCQQWSIYQEAVQKWSTLGMIVKAPSGYPIVNPYLGIANKALGNCQKLWSELGLTPSSRSRITSTGDPGGNDDFGEFDDTTVN